MPAAVVGSGKHCEQLTASKAFEAIHYTFMSSKDKLRFIILQEVLHTIRAKFDDVACTVWIANKIWLNAKLAVTVSRIRPQNIDY